MKVIKHVFYPMGQNTYIVADDSKNCVIIDLGGDFSQIESILSANGLTPLAVIFTHGHFDHILGAKSAADKNIPLYVSEEDRHMLLSQKDCLATLAGFKYTPVTDCLTLEEGTVIFGDMTFEVVKTPGHTKGSVTLITGEYMFTGDTLFHLSVGRTDLPGGDREELKTSINRLIGRDFNYKVLPGHGEDSTLDFEKRFNPYVSR
ncbi:MAG: MBL fold metallo-hydrolase [Clostridia bacterium]|nr:MBL fold metallo-hydrolase [Clostridia bacterium]